MMKGIAGTLVLCMAGALIAAPAAHAKKAKTDTPVAAPKAGGDALADEMTRYTTPGPQHQELAELAGTWSTRTRVWENPGRETRRVRGERGSTGPSWADGSSSSTAARR
jgi:hypothetical protein